MNPIDAVYDCNVFIQALARPGGPAGRCVDLAANAEATLYLSDFVLDEVRHVASRPKLLAKLKVTVSRVETFVDQLRTVAAVVRNVPANWTYSRDPDDAH